MFEILLYKSLQQINFRVGSDRETNSTAMIELSRSPTDSPINHYASSDITGLFPPVNTTSLKYVTF